MDHRFASQRISNLGKDQFTGRKATLPKIIAQPDFPFNKQNDRKIYQLIKYPDEMLNKNKNIDLKLRNMMEPA